MLNVSSCFYYAVICICRWYNLIRLCGDGSVQSLVEANLYLFILAKRGRDWTIEFGAHLRSLPFFSSASLRVCCNKRAWRSLRVSMSRVWLLQAIWRCRKVAGKVQRVLTAPSLHPLRRLQMGCFERPFITDSRECRGNYCALIFNS